VKEMSLTGRAAAAEEEAPQGAKADLRAGSGQGQCQDRCKDTAFEGCVGD
jgi:hypothetical protein